MADMKYSQLKVPDDARQAHREQQMMGSLIESIMAGAEMEAVDAVRASMPQRATALGAEAFQVGQRLEFQEKRAKGLRSLTGATDTDIDWSNVTTTLANKVLQEEEMLVRFEDEATNATAYNIDPNEAKFQFERQKARVDAFTKAYNDAKAKSEPVPPVPPKRSGHPANPDS